MQKYVVEYSSNNSGGSWWLKDEDWTSLEKAGWSVDWVKDSKFYQKYHGGSNRWLGALATRASLVVEAEDSEHAEMRAMGNWEWTLGQSASEQGCSCCGQPHYFYASKLEAPVV